MVTFLGIASQVGEHCSFLFFLDLFTRLASVPLFRTIEAHFGAAGLAEEHLLHVTSISLFAVRTRAASETKSFLKAF